MRFLPAACLASISLTAAPAVADPANASTYREVIAHGIVIVTPGLDIDVKFTPDGKFTALKGASHGVWRIDGEKLCSTPEETLIESCGVYPAGKKSGDTFEIDAPGGKATLRIN